MGNVDSNEYIHGLDEFWVQQLLEKGQTPEELLNELINKKP
jgi:hypothetical protein